MAVEYLKFIMVRRKNSSENSFNLKAKRCLNVFEANGWDKIDVKFMLNERKISYFRLNSRSGFIMSQNENIRIRITLH